MSLPWSYTSRLGRDLDRWHAAGYLDDDGRAKIEADVASRGAGFSVPGALGILGATLIGFSAMTFVAANWQEMSKLARLVLLMAGMWGAYATAAVLFSRQMTMFGDAAVLAGTAIFGAGIMLVAQMYHMEGNPPDAVLLWAVGALAAGAAFRSGPVLALAMLLVGLWSGWEMQLAQGVHWPFLLGWLAVAAAFLWLRWKPGLRLSALMLGGWLIALSVKLPNPPHFWLLVVLGFGIAAVALAAERSYGAALEGRVAAVAPEAAGYGVTLGLVGLLAMQFWQSSSIARMTLLGLVIIAVVIAVIFWAAQRGNRHALKFAYGTFGIEIVTLYFRTLGTLIDTSLFFALTGVFVIVLAVAGYRLMKSHGHLLPGVRP